MEDRLQDGRGVKLVIASEAKQSSLAQSKDWIASSQSAPRNDG
jgi:hypothetical protein